MYPRQAANLSNSWMPAAAVTIPVTRLANRDYNVRVRPFLDVLAVWRDGLCAGIGGAAYQARCL
jgi:hypothetical protein